MTEEKKKYIVDAMNAMWRTTFPNGFSLDGFNRAWRASEPKLLIEAEKKYNEIGIRPDGEKDVCISTLSLIATVSRLFGEHSLSLAADVDTDKNKIIGWDIITTQEEHE